MTPIEAMARAMCRKCFIDPDVSTYPGITPQYRANGEVFSLMPFGWQAAAVAPAWKRYVPAAEAAYEALSKATEEAK